MKQQEKEDATREMRLYFRRSTDKAAEQIAHTLDVLSYAERILEGEGIDSPFVADVIVLAALFHDIGIPESQRKYGSNEPKYQHLEGPPIARSILTDLGVRPDILERVCFIVGNHHHRNEIDSIDFQIVYEADYIVNTASAVSVRSKELGKEHLETMYSENLSTATARRLIRELG